MTIARPEWFDYVVWDYSDPSFPVMKGLKKNTPKKIIEQFKKDQKMYKEAEERGEILRNIYINL